MEVVKPFSLLSAYVALPRTDEFAIISVDVGVGVDVDVNVDAVAAVDVNANVIVLSEQ